MSEKKRWARHLPAMLGVALVVLVVGGVIYMMMHFLQNTAKPKKAVQEITLLQPPPPPPPPPPEVQPPEPEIQEEVKIDEQEPLPDELPETPTDEAPPGEQLGLDAEGGAGSDGFGLLGNKGGRSLLGGGGGGKFAWYAGILQQDLGSKLNELEQMRKAKYSIRVKLWIDGGGKIERFELMGSTGNRQVDETLKVALADLGQVREAPPQDMPQPIRVRISSRL